MFSLEIECTPAEREMVVADLLDLGVEGVVELDETRLRAFFDDAADRMALRERYPRAHWREEEQRDWVEHSRSLWRPLLVGSRFFLVPEWLDDPAPAGRFRIPVNPGMAFGTGVHETTQLCLEALERQVAPGSAVLDVGSGSGILAHAALLLRAGRVYACDIDPTAVQVARGKFPHVPGFVGSADAAATGAVDIVVANISPEGIVGLWPELRRCLRSNGVAVLSGFERHEVDWVQSRLPHPGGVFDKGNWACIEVKIAEA